MRVIGGEFRSRRLKTLPGLGTRPTPDRLRETLFNILAPRLEGVTFLDAYAGTGAVGIEALSRGAQRAIFIDRSRAAVNIIRENLAALGLAWRAEVYCGRALQEIERLDAGIAFLDPPYELQKEYRAALQALQDKCPLVILQHSRRSAVDPSYGPLSKTRTVQQGDNLLSFYECREIQYSV